MASSTDVSDGTACYAIGMGKSFGICTEDRSCIPFCCICCLWVPVHALLLFIYFILVVLCIIIIDDLKKGRMAELVQINDQLLDASAICMALFLPRGDFLQSADKK